MPQAELLLLKPIENLGHEGEFVKVKPGYARNFLLPRKLAVPVTRANRRQVEVLKSRREDRLRAELSSAQEIAEKLSRTSIAIAVKTGPGGKVFGSVTAQELVDRLAQEGITLNKKQVHLHTPAKSLGKHETRIKLHPEISVDFSWEIVSENPIQDEEGNEQSAS